MKKKSYMNIIYTVEGSKKIRIWFMQKLRLIPQAEDEGLLKGT